MRKGVGGKRQENKDCHSVSQYNKEKVIFTLSSSTSLFIHSAFKTHLYNMQRHLCNAHVRLFIT